MKRDLNKDERKLTEKGIERKKKEIKEAEEAIEYNKQQKEFQQASWKWEEYSTPIKRKKLLKEYETAEEMANLAIKDAEHSIKEMEKHLKEGVEEKTPSMI